MSYTATIGRCGEKLVAEVKQDGIHLFTFFDLMSLFETEADIKTWLAAEIQKAKDAESASDIDEFMGNIYSEADLGIE